MHSTHKCTAPDVQDRGRVGWRPLEAAAIDTLRRMGATLRHGGGTTWLVDEVIDDDTGQLVQTRYLINIEDFARTLAQEIRQ